MSRSVFFQTERALDNGAGTVRQQPVSPLRRVIETRKQMKNRKPQKLSWQYLFFARRIQTGPRHYAAKLVLLHLADAADDNGRSWHGHKSISAFSNGLSRNAIYEALCFLRDHLKVLTWKTGSGGFNKKDTNTYTLDLEAMKVLVAEQGVFDPETGKLLRPDEDGHVIPQDTTEPQSCNPRQHSVVSSEGAVVSSEASVVSSERAGRVIPDDTNPHGTHRKNPQKTNPGLRLPFCANGSASPMPTIAPQSRNAPPVPRPPHESVLNAPFKYGDPLPGLKWAEHRSAYVDAAGREIAPAELDTRIAAYAAMKEPNAHSNL